MYRGFRIGSFYHAFVYPHNLHKCTETHIAPAHFQNGESCQGGKILASGHMMTEQFENGWKFVSKTRCETLMLKKFNYTLRIDQCHSKSEKKVLFSSSSSDYAMPFQNVPVRVLFSKSTVVKICRQKMCRFRVNGRPIHRVLHRFQNAPASC